ncbi:MAG: hypothetical protein ACYCZR_01095 [Burkholderiales bacterium]
MNEAEVTDSMIWLVIVVAVCGIVGILAISTIHAQTFYSTDEGTGLAVELMPGVTYFAGPRSGFAIETMPGVTRYDLHDADRHSSKGTLYDLSPTGRPSDRAPSFLDRPHWTERDSILDQRPSWETRR